MTFPPGIVRDCSRSLDILGVCADVLSREGIGHQFVGPEPILAVSRQNIRKKAKMLDG
jgi:hypothetical protein